MKAKRVYKFEDLLNGIFLLVISLLYKENSPRKVISKKYFLERKTISEISSETGYSMTSIDYSLRRVSESFSSKINEIILFIKMFNKKNYSDVNKITDFFSFIEKLENKVKFLEEVINTSGKFKNLTIPLEELGLSPRLLKILGDIGIKDLLGIISYEGDFLKNRNFGGKSFYELQNLLKFYNLKLKQNETN